MPDSIAFVMKLHDINISFNSAQIPFANKIFIDGRIFVTTLKEISSAVPATLMTVNKMIKQGSPLLRLYPDACKKFDFKDMVRYSNAIILYVSFDNKLFQ